jgi:uncharacterized protein (TIGR00369 family)
MVMSDVHPAARFFEAPHPIHLDLKIRFIGVEGDTLTVELVAPESFVTNTQTGAVHSGLATLVLDTVMGGAVMGSMKAIRPIATASLTVQHLRRARGGERLICKAFSVGIHSEIAHMTGQILNERGEVLATATAAFMMGTRSKPLGERV